MPKPAIATREYLRPGRREGAPEGMKDRETDGKSDARVPETRGRSDGAPERKSDAQVPESRAGKEGALLRA
ncbi:hypothetical protein V502_04704 [Pseudogymnoascus sp. VKM F-4520 (FW-2644)]|nr:hypothetical protein V502_04704 [Pseudogymnoascus sp. VKM F-4520 (FW-2644)]